MKVLSFFLELGNVAEFQMSVDTQQWKHVRQDAVENEEQLTPQMTSMKVTKKFITVVRCIANAEVYRWISTDVAYNGISVNS